MIVLIENYLQRVNCVGANPYEELRAQESNAWCEVTGLQFGDTIAYDENGISTKVGRRVDFIGLYSDGTKRHRIYDTTYAWLVKKESMK